MPKKPGQIGQPSDNSDASLDAKPNLKRQMKTARAHRCTGSFSLSVHPGVAGFLLPGRKLD